MKTPEDAMSEEVNFCGPVKKSLNGFCLSTLEFVLKCWPVWSYFDLKSTPRVPGDRPLMNIGYKYNYRKTL